MRTHEPYKVLSLFAGIGGFDLGLLAQRLREALERAKAKRTEEA